jgi:regulator of PEP synthase PpsR (kinase-PPPase family)
MPSRRRSRPKYICVISDATGATAERVVRATLAQFSHVDVELDLVPKVTTVPKIRALVRRAQARKGLIAYTLVETPLRSEIASLANEAGVATVDLMGPLMTALSKFLTVEPAHLHGLFSQTGDEHYRRLEAVSYTVRHDDGLGMHAIREADLVIVGPSRTSKTPLSVYIAHTRGLKVANVPLALGVAPFRELDQLPQRKVVGLTMRAGVLSQVRQERLKEMGNPKIEYADQSHVERELKFCHEVYRSPPAWAVVDVTGKSIEEIASEICALTVDHPGVQLPKLPA